MANEDVEFQVGAEDTGVEAVMAQVQETITASIESIKGSIESITGVFEKVNEAFLAFTAVLAGGEAFKEAINTTVSMTVESVALGHQLGISATEASQLKVALGSVFVTQDQYSTAAAKITMALKKNEKAFNEAGVATRDSNGALLSTQEIMQNVTAHLQGFTEGQNRNVEAAKLLGKGWLDFIPVMRVTGQVIEEGAAKADALGLTVGVEGAAKVKQYRTAMNDVHEVIEAVENVIGQALMPTLTAIGEWFGEVGPEVVTGFRAAFNVLGTVFTAVAGVMQAAWELEKVILDGLGAAFEGVIQFVMGFYGAILGVVPGVKDSIAGMFGGPALTPMQLFVNMIKVVEVAFIILSGEIQGFVQIVAVELEGAVNVFKMFGQVADRAFHLDWAGVKTAWSAGLATLEADAKARLQKIADIAKETGDKVQAAIMGDAGAAGPNTPTAKPPPEKPETPTPDKDKSQMAAMEAELAEFKANMAEKLAAQGDFQEFSKQMDKDYWQAILDTTDLNAKDQVSVRRKIADDTIAIEKDAYTAELAGLKAQESQYKTNLEAKLILAQQYAAKIEATNPGSAAAKAAAGEVLTIERQLAAQRLQIADTYIKEESTLEMSKVDAAERAAQLQNQLGTLSNAQLLAEEQTFENERYQLKVTALQKSMALALLDNDQNPAKAAEIHAQMLALETQYYAKSQELRDKSIVDSNKDYKALFATMQSGFDKTISDFLKGTQSLSATVKGLFTDVGTAIASTLAQLAAKNIATMLQQAVVGKTIRASEIRGDAGKAASGAYSAIAGIPYVGPFLAPAAAAVAYAATMAFDSAEGGYDVAAGVNPITQLHAKEMVLPQKHADVIRSLADSGSSSGGGGGAMHLHVPALDGHSVQKVLTRNAGHVTKAMKKINARFVK